MYMYVYMYNVHIQYMYCTHAVHVHVRCTVPLSVFHKLPIVPSTWHPPAESAFLEAARPWPSLPVPLPEGGRKREIASVFMGNNGNEHVHVHVHCKC